MPNWCLVILFSKDASVCTMEAIEGDRISLMGPSASSPGETLLQTASVWVSRASEVQGKTTLWDQEDSLNRFVNYLLLSGWKAPTYISWIYCDGGWEIGICYSLEGAARQVLDKHATNKTSVIQWYQQAVINSYGQSSPNQKTHQWTWSLKSKTEKHMNVLGHEASAWKTK